jgi:RNA polymerase sigma-70 factor (ECF subfamily)
VRVDAGEAGSSGPASARAPSTGLDEAAIRAFVTSDYPRIVTALSVMCGSRVVAEDAVQQALAKAWERAERGERIDHLAAWVTVAARNLVRSWFRRVRVERRARAALRDQPVSRESTATSDEHVDVERALAGLTKIQRDTTVLHYYLGMSVAEIAAALGVAEGTVKSTLYRARQILAPALGIDDPTDPTDPTEGVTRRARP